MVGIADGLDASAKHPLCSPVEFNSKQCPPSNVRRLYKTITAVTLSQIFLSSIVGTVCRFTVLVPARASRVARAKSICPAGPHDACSGGRYTLRRLNELGRRERLADTRDAAL